MEPDFSHNDEGAFLTPFQRTVVVCRTLEDAVTFRFADRVLASGESASPTQLQETINVLTRYGQFKAVESLEIQLAQLRASLYLTEPVPTPHPTLTARKQLGVDGIERC